MKQKVITESLKVYPRGRGKVLIITEKSVMPKPKNKSKNPSFLHSYIKSNPENIKLKEYINQDGIKRVYLFPEGKQLSREERLDLGVSLLISITRYSGKRFPYVNTREVQSLTKMKLRRYHLWRMKQQ